MSHTTHFDDCGCLTARYEARIAELEQREREFDKLHAVQVARVEILIGEKATLEAELSGVRQASATELAHAYAHAATLRDALEKIAARGCHRVNDTSGHSDVYDAHEANVNEACEALEATPAASLAAHSQEVWDRGWEEGRRFAATNLAAHDAEVLERAAAVADDYDGDGVSKSGQYTQLGDGALTRSDIARAIRALAAQEVKP